MCVCVPQSSPNNRGGALSDEEALSQIKKGHDTMCVMLSSRHKNLQTVRAVWAREDIKVRHQVLQQRSAIANENAALPNTSSNYQCSYVFYVLSIICTNKQLLLNFVVQ